MGASDTTDKAETDKRQIQLKVLELKEALSKDESSITDAVLQVVCTAAPWAEHSSPSQEKRKQDTAEVLIQHTPHLTAPEQALLMNEIVKIAGTVSTHAVFEPLLDPKMSEADRESTEMKRIWAANVILEANPALTNRASTLAEIQKLASNTISIQALKSPTPTFVLLLERVGGRDAAEALAFMVNKGLQLPTSIKALGKVGHASPVEALKALEQWSDHPHYRKIVVAAKLDLIDSIAENGHRNPRKSEFALKLLEKNQNFSETVQEARAKLASSLCSCDFYAAGEGAASKFVDAMKRPFMELGLDPKDIRRMEKLILFENVTSLGQLTQASVENLGPGLFRGGKNRTLEKFLTRVPVMTRVPKGLTPAYDKRILVRA